MKQVTINNEHSTEVKLEISQKIWDDIQNLSWELRTAREALRNAVDNKQITDEITNVRKVITQQTGLIQIVDKILEKQQGKDAGSHSELDLDSARCEILARISRLRERG